MCGALLAYAWPSNAAASHCEYCNDGLPSRVGVQPPALPPDGLLVLTLHDDRSRQLSQDWWDAVSVEVRDPAGALVSGALRVHDGLTPATWAPDSAWVVGEYSVSITVSRGDECLPLEQTSMLMVDADLSPPEMPEVVVEYGYGASAAFALGNLVCCDGAAPYERSPPGILCPGYDTHDVDFFEGFCTTRMATGLATLRASLDPPETTRFTLRERAQGLRPDDSATAMSVRTTDEACYEFEIIDLVTGETSSTTHCVEQQPGQPLGSFERPEIEGELEANCVGPGYVCERNAWDSLADCWLWPDGEELDETPGGDTEGSTDAAPADGSGSSGCSVGHQTSYPGFVLCLLASLRRRRDATA